MPRMVRLEAPGSLMHVMARGIEGNSIFRDDQDRFEFLKRFANHRSECNYKCIAWCLMPNHYHFLLRSSEKPPSSLMRPLNSGYAKWFNKKYQRRGYLLQDRYKSLLCQDQQYAKELIRYIHLNPIRAGFVSSMDRLAEWQWVGHGFLLGRKSALGEGFQDRNEALRRFGQNQHEAISQYQAFLQEGTNLQDLSQSGKLPTIQRIEVKGSEKGWPAVVGDPEFARAAMERHAISRWRKHRKADYPVVLNALAREVCEEFGIALELLFCRGKKDTRSLARAQFCSHAHDRELLPFGVIAQYLGITISPVVRLVKAEKLLESPSENPSNIKRAKR